MLIFQTYLCYPLGCPRPMGELWKRSRIHQDQFSRSILPYEIKVAELQTGKFKDIAERSGRAQDTEDRGTLEELRRKGYM